MKNNKSDSDFKDLQFVDLRLQNGQVELILRAMELYGYNLKFMVNDNDITNEERSRKQDKLEYTYQQILAIQAEQVINLYWCDDHQSLQEHSFLIQEQPQSQKGSSWYKYKNGWKYVRISKYTWFW